MLKITTQIVVTLLFVITLAPYCPADEIADNVSFETLPPSVVKTVPQCGDTAVDPNLTEISVTFSKDMKVTGHCWSWCSIQDDSFPERTKEPEFLSDHRTCILHVALKPEKTYAIWVNTDEFQSFQDPEKHPAVPYLLVFKTGPGK